jgi:hypothetical protein
MKTVKSSISSLGVSCTSKLLLAAVYPSILFASRDSHFMYLENLYEKYLSLQMKSLQGLWKYCIDYASLNPEWGSSNGTKDTISLHSIMKILQFSNPSKTQLSIAKSIKIAMDLFNDAAAVQLCFLDACEFFFALSWEFYNMKSSSSDFDAVNSKFAKFIELLTDIVQPQVCEDTILKDTAGCRTSLTSKDDSSTSVFDSFLPSEEAFISILSTSQILVSISKICRRMWLDGVDSCPMMSSV